MKITPLTALMYHAEFKSVKFVRSLLPIKRYKLNHLIFLQCETQCEVFFYNKNTTFYMFLYVENVVNLALVMTNNFCFFAEESSGSKLSRCLNYTPITVQQFSEKRISTVTCCREKRDSPTRFSTSSFFHLSWPMVKIF